MDQVNFERLTYLHDMMISCKRSDISAPKEVFSKVKHPVFMSKTNTG